MEMLSLELTDSQFEKIGRIVYKLAGINLHNGKQALVKSRLIKRLKALGISSFEEYLKYLENDESGQEIELMIDILTTNKTEFFREPQHFEFLSRVVLPQLTRHRLRIWSAGCSSGEEPYSIAILLRDEIPDIDLWDVKILATDISFRVLDKAKKAVYDENELKGLDPLILQRFFTCVKFDEPRMYQVNDEVKRLVRFARLNLMQDWPMRGPFDIIFCRNVMIYFDQKTKRWLLQRFWDVLKSGGYLFVGHAESLVNLSHNFKYVQPSVYMK